MKKDFLTITPESGGTASVSAVADPNLLPTEPSTMKVELYFNGTLAVRMSK